MHVCVRACVRVCLCAPSACSMHSRAALCVCMCACLYSCTCAWGWHLGWQQEHLESPWPNKDNDDNVIAFLSANLSERRRPRSKPNKKLHVCQGLVTPQVYTTPFEKKSVHISYVQPIGRADGGRTDGQMDVQVCRPVELAPRM